MLWLEKLRSFKDESGATYRSIADKTGIPQTTIEKLFSGRTNDPKLFMTERIARAMGHSASELLPDAERYSVYERNMILKLRRLDGDGRTRTESVIKSELRRIRAEAGRRFSCMYYDFPVSAGTGEYPDYTTAKIIELDREPPSGTDFVLRIAGDSMEPDFSDGDHVSVKSAQTLEYGDIGIFAYTGNVYIKEYTRAGLRSINPRYSIIKGHEDIRVLGKVLSKISIN